MSASFAVSPRPLDARADTVHGMGADIHLPVEGVEAKAWRIPTPEEESDGTLGWNATSLVTVHVRSGDLTGFGYTYAPPATAELVERTQAPIIVGSCVLEVPKMWTAMVRGLRNAGLPGVASMALAAVDLALWDLKARLLDLPLARLLGALRDEVPAYGSGGPTSMEIEEVKAELTGWIRDGGCTRVKMKISNDIDQALERIDAVLPVLRGATLMVDANGAFDRKPAVCMADALARRQVAWFEEPVSSDDVDGLAHLVKMGPSGVAIAAGEYIFTPFDALRLLQARAVDVLQADATRCGGITGLLKIAALAEAFHVPLSLHCAPAIQLHVACALPGLQHMEWFVDHVRIEQVAAALGSPRFRHRC
jgi:L-alanine-DL-glutamate epimerase-like enolase superfamily enzyme